METLRLYPPISGLNKISPKDGTILSSYHIPAGTLISVSITIEYHQISWKLYASHEVCSDESYDINCSNYYDAYMYTSS